MLDNVFHKVSSLAIHMGTIIRIQQRAKPSRPRLCDRVDCIYLRAVGRKCPVCLFSLSWNPVLGINDTMVPAGLLTCPVSVSLPGLRTTSDCNSTEILGGLTVAGLFRILT